VARARCDDVLKPIARRRRAVINELRQRWEQRLQETGVLNEGDA
jgi:hypothetical protein